MRIATRRIAIVCVLLHASPPLFAQVFSSEFFSTPGFEGWELIQQYCNPATWIDDGWYHQYLDLEACPPGPPGGRVVYRRSLEPFNGLPSFFLEFRLETDGDSSEIPYGGPTVVVLGNNAGVLYHLTVANDLIQFFRDAYLPIWLIEIEPDVPHTYRIELNQDAYAFYIDGDVEDRGDPEGPFPADTPRVTWQGQSWYLPCHNAWDYIRYGVISADGSGDYDGSLVVDLIDLYFVQECLTNVRPGINGGPEENAGPGCRFADFDRDTDTDLLDFAEFQNLFAPSP